MVDSGKVTMTGVGDALKRRIAPGLVDFDRALIPDMTEHHSQSRFWVDNYFLNSVFTGKFTNDEKAAFAHHFLRRTQAAFCLHEQARRATFELLDSGGQSPSRYWFALLQWEFFTGQSWHAWLLLRKFFAPGGGSPKVFMRGDGSIEERLNIVYNAMKHVEDRIGTADVLAGELTPVWLSNRGIECVGTHLAFEETATVLEALAQWAEIVVEPRRLKEKLEQESPLLPGG